MLSQIIVGLVGPRVDWPSALRSLVVRTDYRSGLQVLIPALS